MTMAFRNWELCEYSLLPQSTGQTCAIITMSQLEKPQIVILAFQIDRKDKIKKYSSIFDHIKLNDVKLFLYSTTFPYNDFNLKFDIGRFELLYECTGAFKRRIIQAEKTTLHC
jgi:hypothetical protein